MVVEFAAAIPLLLIMFVGLTEMGRAVLQANAIEKGMRAAAVYAVRVDNVGGSLTQIENLVKTGTLDGSGGYLVSGWSKAGANVTVSQSSFDLDGESMPVVKLTVSVPFDPILPNLVNFVGLNDFTIKLSHEQAYVDH